MKHKDKLVASLIEAMWKEDLEFLDKTAPCHCCCYEHYSENCIAMIWAGCKSGLFKEINMSEDNIQELEEEIEPTN